MSKLTVTRGDSITTILFEGTPALAHILHQHGLMIETPCGGKGVCGKSGVCPEGKGNASLAGAVMLLMNRDYVQVAAGIAEYAVTVPLGDGAVFAEYYTECMMFV
jgi:uncharacterized 2Fe-2S/4Fe-4S cluster protein (DUF4445 family)